MKIEDRIRLSENNYSNAVDTVNLPRHRWYYYKEGFSPHLVEIAIKELNLNSNSLVLDPFNGSGTVTLTCALRGIPSIGVEVNPFTAFIAKTKTLCVDAKLLEDYANQLIRRIEADTNTISRWVGVSTFTESEDSEKWLFNRSVADAYECGLCFLEHVGSPEIRDVLKLALISSLMSCSNARRDGKCFKYKDNWRDKNTGKAEFLSVLSSRIDICLKDVVRTEILEEAQIVNRDSRKYLVEEMKKSFSLCITSPPYLNTFDYTDIYRPELFFGGFIDDNSSLYNLRMNTIRSHVQARWPMPQESLFGPDYESVIKHLLANTDKLMSKRIPIMVQAYFEDMHKALSMLWNHACVNAQVWFVVSTSAYAGVEVPVDKIIADIGVRTGFTLLNIVKLRDIRKRKTKYSENIQFLRESLVILKKQ